MNTIDKAVILAFLKDWLHWAEFSGINDFYNPNVGLCSCLRRYLFRNISNSTALRKEFIEESFLKLFINDGLCSEYPFGETTYEIDYENSSQHTNKHRLAWVNKTIDRLQEELNEV